VAQPSARAQKVKWCVKTQKELDKCKHLAMKSSDSIVCLHKPSISECIKSIRVKKMCIILPHSPLGVLFCLNSIFIPLSIIHRKVKQML